MHPKKSELANKEVVLSPDFEHPQFKIGNEKVLIEDWWDRIVGKSWKDCDGNSACMIYGMRTGLSKIPIPNDDEVLYGKYDGLGLLIHVSEIKD